MLYAPFACFEPLAFSHACPVKYEAFLSGELIIVLPFIPVLVQLHNLTIILGSRSEINNKTDRCQASTGCCPKPFFNEILIKKLTLGRRIRLCQAKSHSELIKKRTKQRPK